MSKKGFIYKLVCNDVDIKETYIGSTQNFRSRKNCHKCACNNKNHKTYNYYIYQFIREHGEWSNWNMIQIEEYDFNTRNELNARERYWIETLQSKLNKQMPTRTKKEYYQLNSDKIKDYQQLNSNKIRKYKKEYHQQH